MSEITFQNNIT